MAVFTEDRVRREYALGIVMAGAAGVLTHNGFEGEARRVRRTEIRLENNFRCVFRTLRACEASLNVSLGGLMGESRRGCALEVIILARAAAVALLTDPEPWAWVEALGGRIGSLPGGFITLQRGDRDGDETDQRTGTRD